KHMENQELDTDLINSYLTTQKEIEQIDAKISSAIANLQKDLEEKRVQGENIKLALKEAMIKKGVKKFENDVISLTYVAPTTKKTIDTKKLKDEKPELWEEYSQISDVSDSIRIKV